MPPDLVVSTSQQDAATVLAVSGEIDLATAPDLQQALAAASGAEHVVADLSAVTFMDSTGLRVLISAHEAASTAGHKLSLVAPEGMVTKVLRITGVDRELNVFGSLSDALGSG